MDTPTWQANGLIQAFTGISKLESLWMIGAGGVDSNDKGGYGER